MVGDSTRGTFPFLTYDGLNQQEVIKAYAVDPGGSQNPDIQSYPSLSSLPERPDTAVLEVPKEDCKSWVEKCVGIGVKRIWIHMRRETQEAIDYAGNNSVHVEYGSCAVMYICNNFSGMFKLTCPTHRVVAKTMGKY